MKKQRELLWKEQTEWIQKNHQLSQAVDSLSNTFKQLKQDNLAQANFREQTVNQLHANQKAIQQAVVQQAQQLKLLDEHTDKQLRVMRQSMESKVQSLKDNIQEEIRFGVKKILDEQVEIQNQTVQMYSKIQENIENVDINQKKHVNTTVLLVTFVLLTVLVAFSAILAQ